MYIAQSHGSAVYEIFTLTAAQIASRDDNLVAVVLHEPVRIVERHRNLGEIHLPPVVGSAEDDVLHAVSADRLRGHLAEHPAHSVGYVRLSASVWSDDDRRADDRIGSAREVQNRPVRERLEAE